MAIKKLTPAPAPLKAPDGFEHLPHSLILYQSDTGEIWGNPAFTAQFGKVSLERFQNKKRLGLIHERPIQESLFTEVGRHEGFALDSVDGSRIPVEIRVSPLGAVEDHVFIVSFDDVRGKQELEKQLIQNHLELKSAFEELKRTQTALVQSAKLASLGELSSGIAHELNQPLQAIMGFSQELAEFEKLSPSGTEFIHDIINASRKMAEIIKSLRSFAREAGDQNSEVPVEHAIREAAKLLSHSLVQKGIELKIQASHGTPMILGNPIQLEQVFVNLFSNARDAIESAHPGRGVIRVDLSHSFDAVVVKVSDDGCGMSEETRSKIFDPFFTTKEVGKGTGLGLSITYGILKKIGARVDVRSELGTGTEFTITFRPQGITQEGEAV